MPPAPMAGRTGMDRQLQALKAVSRHKTRTPAALLANYPRQVYYDMEVIRTRLLECPVEDIRKEGLLIIAMEARSAATMKRKKQNNMRMAAKIKAKYMPSDSKAAPRRKRTGKRSDGGAPPFADRSKE